LSAVPNIELVTVTVFISGFLLGPRLGAGVGAVSAALFSLFNPLGAALPPLLVAQALGQSIAGFAGGIAGRLIVRRSSRSFAFVMAGAAGLALTTLYDVLTSMGAYVTIAGEKTLEGLVKFIVAGILFVGLHIVWNTMVFGSVLVPILRVLDRYRRELTTK
jgi:hypothetical protein